MKIAITASGPDLSSSVDPRFGRCPFFLLVDTDTMEFEAVENSNVSAMSGAGIQSAQFVANKGAKALLTGSCGPNAFQTLQAAGVAVIVGVTGTVQEAVQKYKSGQFQPAPQADVPSHFGLGTGRGQPQGPGFGMGGGMGRGMGRGMGGGMGRGMGKGMGRGMGGGMGRGMGRGMGPGIGYGTSFQPPGMTPSASGMPQLSPEEELKSLKQQAEYLRQQTEMITKRIKELEEKKK